MIGTVIKAFSNPQNHASGNLFLPNPLQILSNEGANEITKSDIVLATDPQQAVRRETTSIMCHARRTLHWMPIRVCTVPHFGPFSQGFHYQQ